MTSNIELTISKIKSSSHKLSTIYVEFCENSFSHDEMAYILDMSISKHDTKSMLRNYSFMSFLNYDIVDILLNYADKDTSTHIIKRAIINHNYELAIRLSRKFKFTSIKHQGLTEEEKFITNICINNMNATNMSTSEMNYIINNHQNLIGII